MRKDMITAGEVYAADGPGESWEAAKLVRVKVLELDVEPAGRQRSRGSLTRVELLDDIEWDYLGHKHTAEAGRKYVVANKAIRHEWTEEDDERVRHAARRRAGREELHRTLLALGLPEHVSGFERRRRDDYRTLEIPDDLPGFRVGAHELTIDAEAVLPWLEKIDPARIARRAVERYIEHAGGGTMFEASIRAVIEELEAELSIAEGEAEQAVAAAG